MKTTLLFAFALLLNLALYGQEGCTKFKDGTFKVTDPATKKTSIITRSGNKQTEKMEDAEEVYDFDVVWVDDCTYTITPTAATAARNETLQKAGTMLVKITKVKEHSYIQRVTVASNPKYRRIDEVFLVEPSK
ncbi:hypothetical protein ACLI1A_05230 [Flavobacterium sp. RHBU_3]|uniref:hypothetical protein n=1 Tax=Flavobacterium sp. RHBU_3 TaxID=3391184 RepID=UPI003984FB30